MSSIFKLISRACLAGLLVLAVQVGASAAEKLPADVGAKIQTLISKAIKARDASVLEDGLFELVENNTGLAVAVAGYASSQLPATLPASLPADFKVTLVIATAAGPVLADPSQAGEIIGVVEENQPEFALALLVALEEILADVEGLEGFETAVGEDLEDFETASGVVPPPTFGDPPPPPAENPSLLSASPSG